MKNALKKIYVNMYPSIIYASFIAVALVPIVYWEGIKTRYLANNLVAFDINAKQIESIVFSYLSKSIVDTFFTIVFWSVAAFIGIFMVWMLLSTYTSISNILIVETGFRNKPKHHLRFAIINILQRVVVSVASMISVISIVKVAIPFAIVNIGKNLLSNELSATSFVYVFAWILALALLLDLIWLIYALSTNYLKSSVE